MAGEYFSKYVSAGTKDNRVSVIDASYNELAVSNEDAAFIVAARNSVEAIRLLVAREEQMRELLGKALARLERHHGNLIDADPCPTCEVVTAIRKSLGE